MLLGFLFSLVFVSLLLYLCFAVSPSPFPRSIQNLLSNTSYNPLPVTPSRVYPSHHFSPLFSSLIFQLFLNHIRNYLQPDKKNKQELKPNNRPVKHFLDPPNLSKLCKSSDYPIQESNHLSSFLSLKLLRVSILVVFLLTFI